MLPALPQQRDVVRKLSPDPSQSRDNNQLYHDDPNEKKYIKEQLVIQNDIISKLYNRLNQLERQMGNDNKMFGRLLTDTITSQSQKQNRIDENTVLELESTKNKFNTFSTSLKEDVATLRQVVNQTNTEVRGLEEYITTLFQSEKIVSGKLSKLQINSDAAMECIRSLQGMSKVFDKKLQKISDDASTNEDQITSSLQQITQLLDIAKHERKELETKIDHNAENVQKMLGEFVGDLELKDIKNNNRDDAFIQSIEGISHSVQKVEQRFLDEILASNNETRTMIGSLQSNFLKEKGLRTEMETELRRETAIVINNLKQHLLDELTASIAAYQQDRAKIQKSIKQLNESVAIIEQSNSATKSNLEQIMQAEIKKRLSQYHELDDAIKTTQSALGAIDNKREDEATSLRELISDEMLKNGGVFKNGIDKVELDMLDIKKSVTVLQGEVEECSSVNKDTVKELLVELKETKALVLLDLEEKARELWDQIEVLIQRSEENSDSLKQDITHLNKQISSEVNMRNDSMLKIGSALQTKVDKVNYDGDLAKLNKTIFEIEERLQGLMPSHDDTKQNDDYQVLKSELGILRTNNEPIEDYGADKLIADIIEIKEHLKLPGPIHTPERTLPNMKHDSPADHPPNLPNDGKNDEHLKPEQL